MPDFASLGNLGQCEPTIASFDTPGTEEWFELPLARQIERRNLEAQGRMSLF
jgi:hypothetical protein